MLAGIKKFDGPFYIFILVESLIPKPSFFVNKKVVTLSRLCNNTQTIVLNTIFSLSIYNYKSNMLHYQV